MARGIKVNAVGVQSKIWRYENLVSKKWVKYIDRAIVGFVANG